MGEIGPTGIQIQRQEEEFEHAIISRFGVESGAPMMIRHEFMCFTLVRAELAPEIK